MLLKSIHIQMICVSIQILFLIQAVQSSGSQINGLNMKLYGHRGGIRDLVPEHTIASYTIGAQQHAQYLEPDLMLTKDGELIVYHGPDLGEGTDVSQHPEFADRFKSFSVWERGDPNNPDPNQPPGLLNDVLSFTGWMVSDFTLPEIKTLKNVAIPYPDSSPLNGIFEMLTFNEFLKLTNDLANILNRDIGVIPEIKHAEWHRSIGFNDMEFKVLESLRQYGFVYVCASDGYYKPYRIFDKQDDEYIPAVILQSYSRESLITINEFSNKNIKTFFLMEDYDEVSKETMSWALAEADGIGTDKLILQQLLDVRAAYSSELGYFDIAAYTSISDINEYISYIENDVQGVWTEDVSVGRAIKDILRQYQLNKYQKYSGYTKRRLTGLGLYDIDGQRTLMVIVGIMALLCGVFIGVIGFYCASKTKSKYCHHERVNNDDVELEFVHLI